MHEVTSEHITAASYPLVLTIKDKTETFQINPLTDKDMSELTRWVQAKIIETAYRFLPPRTSSENIELGDRAIAIAQKEAAASTWNNSYGGKILDTTEGRARLLWQTCPEKVKEKRDHISMMVFFHQPGNEKKLFYALSVVSPSLFNPEVFQNDDNKNENNKNGEMTIPTPQVDLGAIGKKKLPKHGTRKNSKKSRK